MKQVFYKREGRRYVPVYEYDSHLLDSFGKGNHLVMSYPGGQSRKYNVDPALAPMIAAGRYAEDAMSKAMVAASEAKPTKQPLTEKQVAAWNKMKKLMDNEMFGLQYDSTHAIIDAGVKAMQEEANKLLSNPAVKKAYDNFILISQLAMEHNNDTTR